MYYVNASYFFPMVFYFGDVVSPVYERKSRDNTFQKSPIKLCESPIKLCESPIKLCEQNSIKL